jgi:hypothetical protein
MLIVDLEMEEGTTGRAYLFCYTPSGARAIADHIQEAVDLVRGKPTTSLDSAPGCHPWEGAAPGCRKSGWRRRSGDPTEPTFRAE